jgi:hypothetical protein
MAAKHGFVVLGIVLLFIWTVRYRKTSPADAPIRSLAGATLGIGLAVVYFMMIILLLHEGVDHAL